MYYLRTYLPLVGWFGLYKIAWLGTIYGALYGYPNWGAIPMLVWSVAWIYAKENSNSNLLIAIYAALYGAIADSVLVSLHTFAFSTPTHFPLPSPLWMISLWFGFGALTHECFHRLYPHLFLSSFIGGTGGAFAYWGGVQMNALTIVSSLETFLIAIGIEWAIAFPVLLVVSKKLHQKH